MTDLTLVSDDVAALVAYAMTGEWLDIGEVASASQLVATLSELGWDADSVERVRESHARWPIPVRAAGHGVGSAQLAALIAEVSQTYSRARAGVRDTHMPLSQRDRQLLADRPPHHGSVG